MWLSCCTQTQHAALQTTAHSASNHSMQRCTAQHDCIAPHLNSKHAKANACPQQVPYLHALGPHQHPKYARGPAQNLVVSLYSWRANGSVSTLHSKLDVHWHDKHIIMHSEYIILLLVQCSSMECMASVQRLQVSSQKPPTRNQTVQGDATTSWGCQPKMAVQHLTQVLSRNVIFVQGDAAPSWKCQHTIVAQDLI